ncbi:hypothetical protein K438DRAFT_1793327 [Mycena galopus ATCC 62051]|nr:hypothetical protein K438DRAFT_1793327 [Mycena galopus ATCC 62051]
MASLTFFPTRHLPVTPFRYATDRQKPGLLVPHSTGGSAAQYSPIADPPRALPPYTFIDGIPDVATSSHHGRVNLGVHPLLFPRPALHTGSVRDDVANKYWVEVEKALNTIGNRDPRTSHRIHRTPTSSTTALNHIIYRISTACQPIATPPRHLSLHRSAIDKQERVQRPGMQERAWYSGGLGLYSLNGQSKDKSQLKLPNLGRGLPGNDKWHWWVASTSRGRNMTIERTAKQGVAPPTVELDNKMCSNFKSRDERMWHEEKPNRRPPARMRSILQSNIRARFSVVVLPQSDSQAASLPLYIDWRVEEGENAEGLHEPSRRGGAQRVGEFIAWVVSDGIFVVLVD